MIDFNQALLDPTSVFKTPQDVLRSSELSDGQKIQILRRREYDAREIEVAEEENMIGTHPGMLDQVLKALNMLHAKQPNRKRSPPTKQGGA
jgi:hypothetical protein